MFLKLTNQTAIERHIVRQAAWVITCVFAFFSVNAISKVNPYFFVLLVYKKVAYLPTWNVLRHHRPTARLHVSCVDAKELPMTALGRCVAGTKRKIGLPVVNKTEVQCCSASRDCQSDRWSFTERINRRGITYTMWRQAVRGLCEKLTNDEAFGRYRRRLLLARIKVFISYTWWESFSTALQWNWSSAYSNILVCWGNVDRVYCESSISLK